MTQLETYYNALISLSSQGVIGVSLLPLLYGLIRWRTLQKTLKIFFFYLLVTFCLNVTEQVLFWAVSNYKDFWWPILHAYHIEDTNFFRYPYHLNNFLLLGWFLFRILQPQPLAKWVKGLSMVLAAIVTVNYFFIQGYNMAGGVNSTVSALYCAVLPLISMWFLYNRSGQVPLVHNPYFWINLGLIIPSLLGLFLYFAGDVMYKDDFVLFARLTILKNGIEVLAQLLTAVGFYYARNAKYLDSL